MAVYPGRQSLRFFALGFSLALPSGRRKDASESPQAGSPGGWQNPWFLAQGFHRRNGKINLALARPFLA